MANVLTGDFDIVAEFAVPAANRVLAAMHRDERFPHAMTLRVDDIQPVEASVGAPTILGSIDSFGDATVDHTRIGRPTPLAERFDATNAAHVVRDPVVNIGAMVATEFPIVPSQLQGRAQLQLSAPTIEVPDASGTHVRMRLAVMARYFPDPQTSPLAAFVQGELQITVAVNQVASQVGNVVDIDIKAADVHIHFQPSWSSQPLSAADVAGVNLLIRNALKTSFVPSSTTLPATVTHMQFKTLLGAPVGAPNAIAVLLNLDGASGNAANANNVFLGAGDDFAFAVGRDLIVRTLRPFTDAVLSQPIDPVAVSGSVFGVSLTAQYTVSLNAATVDLQNGQIILTITGRAHTDAWWLPDFQFRVRQLCTLTPTGATAQLVVGTLSLDITSGGIAGWLASLFRGRALDRLRVLRDRALASAHVQDTVRHLLSADEALGGLLTTLLSPPAHGTSAPHGSEFQLAYTSIDIRPAGVVLHGSMAVTDWPLPHVEFTEIPPDGQDVITATQRGPDYSALRSWIPGGTIERYAWSAGGQAQPFLTDEHRFVLMHALPDLADGAPSATSMPGYGPLCLTVTGARLSSSGPVAAQPIQATACGYTSFPVLSGLTMATDGVLPLITLTEAGPRGSLVVTGHTAARVDETGRGVPNLIVHFADQTSADHLDLFAQALRESRRANTATAVLAVLTPDQVARSRYTEGVIYAEAAGGAWEQMFGVATTQRPVTLIVDSNGTVVWRHEGRVDVETLSTALGKLLVSGRTVSRGVQRLTVRIGQPPPNFVFEYAAGRQLAFRKLVGQPAVLVFWKSVARPSVEAVRELQQAAGDAGGQGRVVLAINDGEPTELAKSVAAELGVTATLVTDPERAISRAYGVNIWPTIVYVDPSGVVGEIRYGGLSSDHRYHAALPASLGRSDA